MKNIKLLSLKQLLFPTVDGLLTSITVKVDKLRTLADKLEAKRDEVNWEIYRLHDQSDALRDERKRALRVADRFEEMVK